MSSLIDQFRQEVETFLAVHDMNATDFGLQAVNDSNFVFELREGRNPRVGTVDRVRQFMRDHAKPPSVQNVSGGRLAAAAA